MTGDAPAVLGTIVVDLAARAADAWSRGEVATAAVYACAMWRLVGNHDYVDDCDCDGEGM